MKADHRAIARAYLDPARPFDRYLYYYAAGKLASDPVYRGASRALAEAEGPLLDVGCGIGLLLHALRGHGDDRRYLGIDLDAAKIAQASRARDRAGWRDARFEAGDIATALPEGHSGSVALLDVLQYLDPDAQTAVIDACARMLAPRGRMVIRSGLREQGARSQVTRMADFLAHRIGWMKATPMHFPTRDGFESRFHALGLRATFAPLHGRTPFNNWLVVAERASP